MHVEELNKENLKKIASQIENTILFLGSGFTKDEHTKFDKKVLSGNELKNYFIEKICEKKNDIDCQQLYNKSFSQISEYYFKFYRDIESHKSFFKQFFTNVKLSKQKINFLNLPWKYYYTLNIDDAIENNLSGSYVVVPNKNINKDEFEDYNKVIFKLHGDVKINLLENNNIIESIVFKRMDYIKAITQEKIIYDIFTTHYKDFNFLIIGASLEDEIDLETFISKEMEYINNNLSEKIYITTNNIDELRKIDLERFNISKIIKIKNYDEFYSLIYDEWQKYNQNSIRVNFNYYQLSSKLLHKNFDDNIDYILGKNIVSKSEKEIIYPYFVIDRKNENNLLENLEKYNFFILLGKRFSGKTYLLANLYKKIQKYNKYFFPSSDDININKFLNFLEMIDDNSVLFFDTFSYNEQFIYYLIKNNFNLIKEKHLKFIFSVDEEDPIYYKLNQLLKEKKESFYELILHNKFYKEELKNINNLLDKLGIIRIKENVTLIDHIFYSLTTLYSDYKNINFIYLKINEKIEKFKQLSQQEKEYLLGVAVIMLIEHKLYSSTFYLIYKDSKKFENLYNFFEYIIERERVNSSIENSHFSGFKYVLECNSCMYYFIKTLNDQNIIDSEFISEIIYNIISKLYETNHKNIVRNLISFDQLNTIFKFKEFIGSREVIFKIYDKLSDILYSDIDYWLQRAKSHLQLANKVSIDKKDKEEIIDKGILYAKKAYEDAKSSKKESQALFTLAILYVMKASINKYNNEYINKEAFDILYNAIFDYKNEKYIKKWLSKQYVIRNIYNLLNNISDISRKSDLLNRIRNIQQ